MYKSQKDIYFQLYGQTHMEFDDCHGNVKNDRLAIDISNILGRMKEQLLKV